MNRFLLISIFTFLLSPAFGQNKKALIVAISDYPKASGFRGINANNDIPIIQSALIKLGFSEKNISILKNEGATKKLILNALQNDFLKSLNKGDIAYFHFSGHGQQVQDLNGDELDGYDEALVPFDASSDFSPGVYEGENHITDDELNLVYNKIRTKLGPKGHFMLTIDACHSGTSTRAIGCARGTDIAIAPEAYRQKTDRSKHDMSQSETKPEDESQMASMIAFFGSMANQLNYEIQGEDGKNYGALSYAFSKAVHALKPESSYQQLFDRIKLIIGMHINNQIPEASGILAQPVLGGRYLGTPNYFRVKEWQDQNTITLDGGFLNGITPGTVMGFYQPESRDIKNIKPISIGTVKVSGSSTCIVEIPDGISQALCESSWVMVKEENFGDLTITIQVKGTFNSLDPDLFKQLFKLPYLKKVDHNPDLILIEDSKKIFLIAKNDIEIVALSKSSSANDLMYSLKSAITQFGQSQYLRKLTQENEQIAVEFKLILIARNGIKVSESFTQDSMKDAAGNLIIRVGDEVKIMVKNTGTKPCYYTLLDIQPDNKTNVLLPKSNDSPSDYYINPGASIIIPTSFRLNEPLGQELFKLIATKNPINLRPLDQRRGMDDHREKDPFEQLINQTYYKDESLGTRGLTSNVPAGQVNIYSLPFIIKK